MINHPLPRFIMIFFVNLIEKLYLLRAELVQLQFIASDGYNIE